MFHSNWDISGCSRVPLRAFRVTSSFFVIGSFVKTSLDIIVISDRVSNWMWTSIPFMLTCVNFLQLILFTAKIVFDIVSVLDFYDIVLFYLLYLTLSVLVSDCITLLAFVLFEGAVTGIAHTTTEPTWRVWRTFLVLSVLSCLYLLNFQILFFNKSGIGLKINYALAFS